MFLIKVLLVLQCFTMLVMCNSNITHKYNAMKREDFASRTNRLLSFNTLTNGDISMEIAFNVPFITIPVKRSVEAAHGAIANVNIGAIILGGAIAFGFAVVIPGVLFLFGKNDYNTRSREADSGMWRQSLEFMESLLAANQIDATACFQQLVCGFVKKSAKSVFEGRGSSSDQIINGLATNEWLLKFVDGTVLKAARDTGLKNYDCSRIYSCKINQKSLENFRKTFTTLLVGYF